MNRQEVEDILEKELNRIASVLGNHDTLEIDLVERTLLLQLLCNGVSTTQIEPTISDFADIAITSIGHGALQTNVLRKTRNKIVQAVRLLCTTDQEKLFSHPQDVSCFFIARVLDHAPDLLTLLIDWRPGFAISVFTALNQATSASCCEDDKETRGLIEAAITRLLTLRFEKIAEAVVVAANGATGTLQDVARESLVNLPDERRVAASKAIIDAATAVVNVNAIPVRLRAFLGDAAGFALREPSPGLSKHFRIDALTLRSHALVDQSLFLFSAGLRREALEASNEAVACSDKLIEQGGEQFLPELASSLNNLGTMLANAGQHQQALEATEKAVDLRRRLADQNRAQFLPELATSLNNMAIRFANTGQRERSLRAIEEAVKIRRELSVLEPQVYKPLLAMSLNNLGVRFADLGRREEALSSSAEAINIYRSLANKDPDAFLPDLAMSLNNIGRHYGDLGLYDDALNSVREGVQIRRSLVSQNRKAFLQDLAVSLNNLGLYLSQTGRKPDALAATNEAVELYRELVVQDRDAFLPDLARTLNNLSGDLLSSGLLENALNAVDEAIAIRWEIVPKNRDAILPDLARAMGSRGNILLMSGRPHEAGENFLEAARLLGPYVKSNSGNLTVLWTALVQNLVRALKASGTLPNDVKIILHSIGVNIDDIEI